MIWTDAQRRAIDDRGHTLLVSAAAGSGKTAVLTERIVSLVKEGAPIDAFLVVTFTKAAAAEMRERILTTLHQEASGGDRHLATQALRVERADISTIHSFCTKVCRQYFQAAEVDPTFRVADGTETAVLRAQAMTEALVACFEDQTDLPFQQAAQCLSQEALAETIAALYSFLMARPDPWTWLEDALRMHDISEEALAASPWMTVMLGKLAMQATLAVDAYALLVSFAAEACLLEDFAREEAAQATQLLAAIQGGFQQISAIAPPVFLTRRKVKGVDDALQQRYAKLRDAAKALLKKAHDDAKKLTKNLTLRAEDERENLFVLQGIAAATRMFHAQFQALKQEKNLLDFNDLEHAALRALRDADVAAAIQTQYDHVFVDEYQDSSLLQEALLKQISRANNLFMVGDVKQSIYRFRQAEPSLFLQKQHGFSRETGAPNQVIHLNANYRSHPNLLQAVNAVFQHVFAGGPMELQYPEDEQLYPGRAYDWQGVPAELHIITDATDASEDEEADTAAELSPEAKLSARQEAELIADQIGALRQAPEKAYRLRDMVILMRTVRGKAAHFVEVLRARGIPAWSDLGEDALERPEVRDIISILQVIDNFRQDIPLLAALRGPALGITDDDLAAIRTLTPEGTIADAVLAFAAQETDLAHALRAFVERIRGWALDAQTLPLDALLRRIYDETGHYALSGARPDGEIRQANLRMLAEHAATFHRAQYGGLSSFLRYLEKTRAQEGITAQQLGDSDDVVRIMSIHKSKGLQFPVVFIVGIGRAFRQKPSMSALCTHPDLGIGMRHIDPQRRTIRNTVSCDAILEKRRQEDMAEEARILYVAMTRAESRLILVGSPRKGTGDALLTVSHPATARSMLEWVAPIAGASEAWTLSYHQKREPGIVSMDTAVREVLSLMYTLPSPDLTGETLSRQLAWSPATSDVRPLKQSVSSLVRIAAKDGEEEEVPTHALSSAERRPLFMEQRDMTATERGNAIHAFLSSVPLDAEDLALECRNMIEKGLLTAEQASALPMRKLERILQGPLWRRMRKATVLHREWPFNLRIANDGERTLLQGIIDCCFIEDGKWVLVDYKSDRADDLAALAARYQTQLQLYARALEEMTSIPVAERMLYSIQQEAAFPI